MFKIIIIMVSTIISFLDRYIICYFDRILKLIHMP